MREDMSPEELLAALGSVIGIRIFQVVIVVFATWSDGVTGLFGGLFLAWIISFGLPPRA